MVTGALSGLSRTDRVDRIVRRMMRKRIYEHLDFTPHEKQREVINAIDRGATNLAINAGTRSGKTELAQTEALVEGAYPPIGKWALNTVPIIAPYKELTDRAFRKIWDAVVDKNVYGYRPLNKSVRERYIEMPWKAMFRGLSADNPEALSGDGWGIAICDEFADFEEEVFETYIERALSDIGGRAILITTPNGRLNHWFKKYKQWEEASRVDPSYYATTFTSYDNPYIDLERVKKVEEHYKRVELYHVFQQEYLALFTKLKGAIYGKFDTERHVRRLLPIVEGVSFDYSIDVGTDHPFVALKAQVVNERDLRIYKEVVATGLDPLQQLRAFKELVGDDPIRNVYIDPSALAMKELFRNNGIPVFEPSSSDPYRLNSVEDGIIDVQELFGDPSDPPRIIIDERGCPNLIEKLPGYARDKKTGRPIKVDDDEMDALRYLTVGAIGLNRNDLLIFSF